MSLYWCVYEAVRQNILSNLENAQLVTQPYEMFAYQSPGSSRTVAVEVCSSLLHNPAGSSPGHVIIKSLAGEFKPSGQSLASQPPQAHLTWSLAAWNEPDPLASLHKGRVKGWSHLDIVLVREVSLIPLVPLPPQLETVRPVLENLIFLHVQERVGSTRPVPHWKVSSVMISDRTFYLPACEILLIKVPRVSREISPSLDFVAKESATFVETL